MENQVSIIRDDVEEPHVRGSLSNLFFAIYKIQEVFPKILLQVYDYGIPVGYELKGEYNKKEIFYIVYRNVDYEQRYNGLLSYDYRYLINKEVYWFKTFDSDREIAFHLVEINNRIDDIKRCQF